jgi:phage-related protein
LNNNAKQKVDYALFIVKSVQRIPDKFFKHVQDGIFEIRIYEGSNIYRIFSFFDKENCIVLLNGFHKKTQKTPKNQIMLAKELRKRYHEEYG